MKTYDPMDSISYVHMSNGKDLVAAAPVRTRAHNRLPADYANESLRTRLPGCVRK